MNRRSAYRDFSAFKALIADPGDLSSGVVLPANGDVYASTTLEVEESTELVDVGARALGVPASVANRAHSIGWLERGKTAEKHAAAPGTVSLWVRHPLGKLYKIAEG